MTIQYEQIYSRFYTMVNDPKFFQLSEDDAFEMMNGWLHNSTSDPYVRKIFSTLSMDDEIMIIDYLLKNSVDKESDEEFVINVLAQCMVINWIKPQVDSVVNLAVVIGGKEEKRLQSNYNAALTRLSKLETNLRKTIRDYGYLYNSYISEDS